ncbi:MAG TPA: SusC/RagA family TonB-linked outer membrane protein [Puia sp.]|nr:SusC/RagA family TonB-linked outer membrane protein [Puia sp.]
MRNLFATMTLLSLSFYQLSAQQPVDTPRTKDTAIYIQPVRHYLSAPTRVDVLYGTQNSENILGSVSSIYTNQLTSTPASLYAYALAGRLPGLYTQQTRGWTSTNNTAVTYSDAIFGQFPTTNTIGSKGPTDNTEINLLLRGQAPVTIVDGVQRDIYTIDPENIESVSVLKDALSSILLGVRSSRGVILVTTKKPVTGPTRLSFTAQTGVQMPLNLPQPLPAYQYDYLYNEALGNQGLSPAYTYNDFEAYRTHSDPYGHPDVDWFNTLLKKSSLISRYSLNISGGGGAARYTVGLGYLNQAGLFRTDNSNYNTQAQIKRYTINTNIDVDVNKYFTTQLQLFARIQDGNQPGGYTDNIISGMYTTPNNAYPVFNPDGSLGGSQAYPRNLYGMVNRSGYVQDYTRDINANLTLKYRFDQFVKGLWFRAQSNLAVYASNITDRSATAPSFKYSLSPAGDTSYSRYGSTLDQSNTFSLTSSAQYWYLQTALGYDREFGKHAIGGKIFYDRYESIFNYDLPATNQNMAATVTYSYAKKYFAEATVNRSGDDRYPPGKQFGWFYAAGLGWDMAKEDFIAHNNSLGWIDKIKWRVTYGRTGNDNVGYFTWRESYTTSGVSVPVYQFGTGRSSVVGAQQNVLANPNISWEKGDKLNAGLDLSLFRNQLQFTAEYYNNKYFDLLQVRGKQSTIIGISYPLENIGINRYTGFEFTTTYQGNYKSLNYFITGNLTLEKTKVLFMDETQRAYPWNKQTGQPVGMTFGYKVDGFIQSQQEAQNSAAIAGYTLQPGDLKYHDMNGDGVINDYDKVPIGQKAPLLYYGITAGFNIKGFDVSALLQGVGNRSYIVPFYAFGGNGTSQAYNYIVGRWTPETAQTATYPRLTPGINASNDPYIFDRLSTQWMQNGNYFRLKNVEIGYTLPTRLAAQMKLYSVRFFANGMNLFTHAAFGRVDPEVNTQVYPIQRVINVGVNVKF